MTIQAKIYLVRHGETDANRKRIIQGQLDIPLSEIGLEQAALVASALRVIKFDIALSSDLSRATATAAAILEEQPGLALCKKMELRERFMGELQGQVYGTYRLPGKESTLETGPAFDERTLAWWRKDIVEYTASLPPREDPYNILVVSHGGFLGTLVKNLIRNGEVSLEKEVVILALLPNVSVSLIEWDGERGRLVRYGDASHLSAGPLDHNADEVQI